MKIKFYRYILMVLAIIGITNISLPIFASNSAKIDDQTLNKIEEKGLLVVGTSADYAPYEFHQTINGKDKIVGFDISLAQAIAKDLNVKLQIKEMSFDALLGGLKTGKVDMIISGMSATPERKKEVNFSKPYLHAGQKMIVLKSEKNKYNSIVDFENKNVAAQKGTTQEDIIINEMQGAKLVSLGKFTDAILQLESGKVAGIVTETPVGTAYVQNDKRLALIPMNFVTDQGKTAIAMPKGANELTSKVNNLITRVTNDGSFDKWQQKANKDMFVSQGFFSQYGSYFISGTGLTLLLAVIGVFFGVVLGILLALMKRIKVSNATTNFSKLYKAIAKSIANIYIEFVRGTPLMVQVYIIFFGATWLFHLNINAFFSGAIAVSLNSAAYVAEIIRSGINSIEDGQNEAARSLGLSSRQSMQFIILPQAVKNILPALGNEFITVIKESSVVSVIGVGELMFKTSTVQGASFNPFLPLVITALIYFVLTFSLSRVLNLFEKKLNLN